MIKVENIDVWGFEQSIRGMRNPMNSWRNSDSYFPREYGSESLDGRVRSGNFILTVGENDLKLMRQLYKAGSEHRKYLRQIFVSFDITAPLYWWKEFDTYKVGTVANSCSTMHKIASKEFTLDDFSVEHLGVGMATGVFNDCLETIIDTLNEARSCYLDDKNKMWWWQMIQLLPASYNQKRTITMNYENVVTMINQRTGHKLDEWNTFIEVLKKLPYIIEIME